MIFSNVLPLRASVSFAVSQEGHLNWFPVLRSLTASDPTTLRSAWSGHKPQHPSQTLASELFALFCTTAMALQLLGNSGPITMRDSREGKEMPC